MAAYLVGDGYKDAAAVMAGGVLEEHLRKLCGKFGCVLPAKPKLDAMNADLAKVTAYSKNDQKQVTAWAGIRNDAAHGDYGKYGEGEVRAHACWHSGFHRPKPSMITPAPDNPPPAPAAANPAAPSPASRT